MSLRRRSPAQGAQPSAEVLTASSSAALRLAGSSAALSFTGSGPALRPILEYCSEHSTSIEEIVITPTMLEAGVDVIHAFGAECASPYFSASDLAIEVYRAMAAADLSKPDPQAARSPKE
jgi:hypothetical protein